MPKQNVLYISIGRRLTFVQACGRCLLIMFGILTIPVVNELVLHGHWSVNFIGLAWGLLLMLATAKSLGRCVKGFETPEVAAEWVKSREWDTPVKGSEDA